jgi:hypothetical protein
MASSSKTLSPDAKSGKYLADARENGVSWDAILEATGAKSAIPLRVVLRAFLLSLDPAKAGKRYPTEFAKVAPVAKATDAEIVRLRDEEGAGFPLISARTGLSVKDVIGAYVRGGGVSASGRVYVGAAGRTLVTGDESVRIGADDAKAAKAAKKARKTAKREAAAKAAKKAAKAV